MEEQKGGSSFREVNWPDNSQAPRQTILFDLFLFDISRRQAMGSAGPEERQADRGPLSVRAARAALLHPSSTLEGSPGFYVPPSDWTPVPENERFVHADAFAEALKNTSRLRRLRSPLPHGP